MHKCVVYVDESGDLGLSERSSKNITLAATITCSSAQLERVHRRLRKRLRTVGTRSMSELKFHHSTADMRRWILEEVAGLQDLGILALTVEKRGFGERLRQDRNAFYLRLCGALVQDIPLVEPFPEQVRIVFDARRGDRSRGMEFDKFVTQRVEEAYAMMGLITPDVVISRYDSLNSRGLQIADFVAGAIQRRHELGDTAYWSVVSSKIIHESIGKGSETEHGAAPGRIV